MTETNRGVSEMMVGSDKNPSNCKCEEHSSSCIWPEGPCSARCLTSVKSASDNPESDELVIWGCDQIEPSLSDRENDGLELSRLSVLPVNSQAEKPNTHVVAIVENHKDVGSIPTSSTKIACDRCGKEVVRRKDFHRYRNTPMNVFCSRSCSGKYRTENKLLKNLSPNVSKLQSIESKEKAKSVRWSGKIDGLRPLLRTIKKRQPASSVTIEDLRRLWEKQNGCCPYTGRKLILRPWSERRTVFANQASIDRIDSSLGYIPGNIEIVSLIANLAKSIFPKETLIDFCRATARHQEELCCSKK